MDPGSALKGPKKALSLVRDDKELNSYAQVFNVGTVSKTPGRLRLTDWRQPND
jgi:hypothetical protein